MQKYIEALSLQNWSIIHEAAKKEASREVTEMNKWLKNAEDYNTLEWQDFPMVKPWIKKAAQYQFRIYNRNKDVKALVRLSQHLTESLSDPYLSPEEIKANNEKIAELADKKNDLESEQYALAGRVLKIYCMVSGYVVLSPAKNDDDDDPITPEDD